MRCTPQVHISKRTLPTRAAARAAAAAAPGDALPPSQTEEQEPVAFGGARPPGQEAGAPEAPAGRRAATESPLFETPPEAFAEERGEVMFPTSANCTSNLGTYNCSQSFARMVLCFSTRLKTVHCQWWLNNMKLK